MKNIIRISIFIIFILVLSSCQTPSEARIEQWEKSNLGNVAIVAPGLNFINPQILEKNKHKNSTYKNVNEIPKDTDLSADFSRSPSRELSQAGVCKYSEFRNHNNVFDEFFGAIFFCLPSAMVMGIAQSGDGTSTNNKNELKTQNIPIQEKDIEIISKNSAITLQHKYQNQFARYANQNNPSNFININNMDDVQINELSHSKRVDGNIINYILEIGLTSISESDGALIMTSSYRIIKLPEKELMHNISMEYISQPRDTPVWIDNSAEALSNSIKDAYNQFTQKIIYTYIPLIDSKINGQIKLNE